MLTAEMTSPALVPLQEQTSWFWVRFNPIQICVPCELSHLMQCICEHLVVFVFPSLKRLHPQFACKTSTLQGRFGQNVTVLGQTLSWQLGLFGVRYFPSLVQSGDQRLSSQHTLGSGGRTDLLKYRLMKPHNGLGWKRPLRMSSPSLNPVPQHPSYTSFLHLQG